MQMFTRIYAYTYRKPAHLEVTPLLLDRKNMLEPCKTREIRQ